jgi:hypothetical protein
MEGEVPGGGGDARRPAQRGQRRGPGGAVGQGAVVQRHQQLRHKALAQHPDVLLALPCKHVSARRQAWRHINVRSTSCIMLAAPC